jgi:flagellar motor switch protein FliN/FliY
MSDSTITQNEINDLLSGSSVKPAAFSDAGLTKIFTAMAGTLLSKFAGDLSDKTGVLFTPGNLAVEKLSRNAFLGRLADPVICLKNDFINLPATEGPDLGLRQLFIDPAFTKKITELVNKEENAEVDDMALNIVSELFTQYTADEVSAISKGGKTPGLEAALGSPVSLAKSAVALPGEVFVITYPFNGDGAEYFIREVLSSSCATAMATALPSPGGSANEGALSAEEINAMLNPGGSSGPKNAPGPTGSMGMGMNLGSMAGLNIPTMQGVQFPTFNGGPGNTEPSNISLISDVFMEMTVELGRTKKQVKDILNMGEGTIIELDKLAGEPVDILVNHKPIAKGEVVVIDENFGVRVTEILSPIDRVN